MNLNISILFKIGFFICGLLLTHCANDDKPKAQLKGALFQEIPSSTTGLDFQNTIQETNQYNFFTYQYVYNGGGLAIADFNNDNLPDIYLTGNQVEDKLYMNKGDLKFEDQTQSAIGKGQSGWHTGVTTVDINNDGFLDIYVCRSGNEPNPANLQNLLYINKTAKKGADLKFEEQAVAYGLNDSGHSTQAAFFDYDLDGDLDCYVMNHPKVFFESMSKKQLDEIMTSGKAESDKLYRNDNGKFVDVSTKAGIYNHAFGLGLSVSDIDDDGFPDLYIANDYDEPDFMYINQRNGTFKDQIKLRTKHISNFGMGTDIADYNNDGYKDIVVLDMSYSDHVRSKRNMAPMSTQKFWGMVAAGKHFQYMSNTLQLNTGHHAFSEVGQMAGIAKTDWSWGALFADFDNDGWKDLVVTNGFKRDVRDRDFQNKYASLVSNQKNVSVQQITDMMPANIIGNRLYQNKKNLAFADKTEDWGFDTKYNSNGVGYADFDLDGDLDLLVNNVDQKVSLYRNNSTAGYLRLNLKGSNSNPFAFGAKVKVKTKDGIQVQELFTTRGYQSAVETVLHFGVDNTTNIESVEVIWPDGKVSKMKGVKANQLLEIDYAKAKPASSPTDTRKYMLTEITPRLKLDFKHTENFYNDFEKEILLPHKQSEHGPFLAVADVNADGLEDFFVGGAKDQSGRLFLQNKNQGFQPASSQPWQSDKASEDLGCVFFDLENDGDLDLYVVSGGNEFAPDDPLLYDRIYVNDGKGGFTKKQKFGHKVLHSGMRVIAGDFNKDGYTDLFVGGRVEPGKYPQAPRSVLYKNQTGVLVDVTPEKLKNPGMITDAVFADINNDKLLDLIVVGEWMPVTCYINEKGFPMTEQKIAGSEGLWFALKTGDFDQDGKMDILAGNLGKNHKFKGSSEKPFNCYANDFDENGSLDIVLSSYQGEKNYPVRGRECSSEQMPFIKEKFPTFESFANAELDELYSESKLENGLHLQVKTFKHSLFLQTDAGFETKYLPMASQISPINKILETDIDQDGKTDIVMAGNIYGAEVETVRHDAGIGNVLLSNGDGDFQHIPYSNSGLYIPGNVKDLAWIKIGNQKVLLVANNNYRLQAFRVN